ncbi:MAG: DUF4738 domain-containing protein [Bacteroidaceae bacterium]
MIKQYRCLAAAWLLGLCVASCSQVDQAKLTNERDAQAAEWLQGIWIEVDGGTVLFRVQGDSIFYVDPEHAPVRYEVHADSLCLYGTTDVRYRIDRLTQQEFCFRSYADDAICLVKSTDADDSLAFAGRPEAEPIPVRQEVLKRDSVVNHAGRRYHAYVCINPSTRKVYCPSFSEEGLRVDKVYFDNVIHLCVYEGKTCLYAQDVVKETFASVVDRSFLAQAVLADIRFMGVDSNGFHFRASIGVPETWVCYWVDMWANAEGGLTLRLVE